MKSAKEKPNNGLLRAGYVSRGVCCPFLVYAIAIKFFNSSGLIDRSAESKRGRLGSSQNLVFSSTWSPSQQSPISLSSTASIGQALEH